MSVVVEFEDELASRVGTRSTYLRVEDGTTVADLLDRLATEFGAPVRAGVRTEADGPVAERRSAVASHPLSLSSRVSPGDRVRLHRRG